MNITLTVPEEAAAAWQARLKKFNDGSGEPARTLQEFLQLQFDEQTAQNQASFQASLLALMQPVGAEIAAAAGGDPAKIAAALEAGKTAALTALQS